MEAIRIAVLTVSDGVVAGTREDGSGALIADWAERAGRRLVARATVPDASAVIAGQLVAWADGGEIDVVITTGGTGFTERDVTPEATGAVVERAAPGLAEAIRARGTANHPHALLSRGVAGIRGRTLLVNLPGSRGGVADGLAVLDTVIEHAVQLLRGIETDHHPTPG